MDIAIQLDDEERREWELYNIIPTLNAMGYMYERYSPNVNEYVKTYINSLPSLDAPVLDIGVSYGVSVIDALQHGATVVANDMYQPHLDILERNVPDEYKDNLTLNCARFPQETNFAENTFGAILISRVINFLTGEELEDGLKMAYKWLKPGGKVYVVAETVHKKLFEKLIPIHEERVAKGHRWPGHFQNVKAHMTHRQKHLPDAIHFFTDRILRRSFEEAGFIVEQCSMFSKDSIPDDARRDGKETVGIIGVKPNVS